MNLEKGYAVLKDKFGISQILLLPTAKISGIEAPELLNDNIPNYWQAAWAARKFMEERLGKVLPRESIGMAINAPVSRSQDQLHIHIDCMNPEVVNELRQHQKELEETGHKLSFPLLGHSYYGRIIKSEDLQSVDPFHLVAYGNEDIKKDMKTSTIIVAGITLESGKPGFAMLYDKADETQKYDAHGEDLQDHACAIAK